MKTILVIAVAGLAMVSVALADDHGGAGAAAACKALEQTTPAMFGDGKTYRNLGACVSAKSQRGKQDATNAAKACKAEQSDKNFAASHGGKSFMDFYGTSSKGRGKGQGNTFGKCVSGKAKTKTESKDETGDSDAKRSNAAKNCKAQRADSAFAASHGGKSFDDYYGTNANKKNAFGKCVSTTVKKD